MLFLRWWHIIFFVFETAVRTDEGKAMTKDVLISIRGIQFAEESDADPVEVITAGEYYLRNGKHYVMYEEVVEGVDSTGKNMIKVGKDSMELTKKGGATSTHMVFEKNKKNVTYYYTPYGSLLIGIDTKKVDIQEKENELKVEVDYELEVNYEHVADCHIHLQVNEKGTEGFQIVKDEKDA